MRRLTLSVSNPSSDRLATEAALSRRLDPKASTPIALALSGGGDSAALLTLVQAWAAPRGRRVLALTVDHGLNSESAAWTRFAGRLAQRVGADWRALHWVGEKPSRGLPAAARAARHALLATAARKVGAEVIVFGHTASDLAEAELMRCKDAPTLGRLYEWSPSPAWPEGRGLFALRPLLHWRREALRSWLGEIGEAWLDDPANQDPQFARARARLSLQAGASQLVGLHRGALQREALQGGAPQEGGAKRANSIDIEAPTFDHGLARHISASLEGSLSLPRDLLSAPCASARRLISFATLCASGRTRPPRGQALARLQALAGSGGAFTATLAGARLTGSAKGVEFNREPGEFRRRSIRSSFLAAGGSSVWDGRFELSAFEDVEIAPLAGRAARLGAVERRRLKEIPPQRRCALPSLLLHGEVLLPQPWGGGPALARSLGAGRLASACGLITQERDISRIFLADRPQSSYVEALALE